jgi:hypothetical protein
MFAIVSPIAITDAAYASAWVTDYIESPLEHTGALWHYDLRTLDLRCLYMDEIDFDWQFGVFDLIHLIALSQGR